MAALNHNNVQKYCENLEKHQGLKEELECIWMFESISAVVTETQNQDSFQHIPGMTSSHSVLKITVWVMENKNTVPHAQNQII